MRLTFSLMSEADARVIASWRYEPPYDIYNIAIDPEDVHGLDEFLERRSPYYAVRDEQGELIGFFNFGTSALVWPSDEPSIYMDEGRTVAIGLGMRPDLTGKGMGLAFVNAGLAFAREQFAPLHFRLYVLTFNERAIQVYERAGFERIRIFKQRNMYGEREFLEMGCEA